MEHALTETRPSYETMLRRLGAHLDAVDATSICVIETMEGFVVRYIEVDGSSSISQDFTYEDLDAPMAKNDPIGSKRRSIDRGGVTYQDFLRALGHEFNELVASRVLIDELDDGFLITYQAVDPHSGLLPHKRIATMGQEEQQLLLEEAYSRRRPTRVQRFGLTQLLGL